MLRSALRLFTQPGKHFSIICFLLVAETAVFHAIPSVQPKLLNQPLRNFPKQVGDWKMRREIPIDADIEHVLKADDALHRDYTDITGHRPVNLVIAFFGSQHAGSSPHSPTVCLPGSGWVPTHSATRLIGIGRGSGPIRVNRYTVVSGDRKNLVFYWYQSHRRTIHSEYTAKLYLMLDSIRYQRSDSSLVRVIVPVGPAGEDGADAAAADFIRLAFQPIRDFLPH